MAGTGVQPGSVIGGDFEIVRPLSEGGMGAVYVVNQRSTGAERALKLMLPEIAANEALRTKFVREAQVGSKIASDHVVEVIAAGIDPASAAPWLVMELLRGEDLASFAATRGALDVGTALEILRQLADAVGAAHEAGIIHRDLKPENVFLARGKGRSGVASVKVLDFGIAKIAAESKTTGSLVMGSPLWMAPEQTSAGAEITPATDVWAFGLIAFFLVTGKLFWRTGNADMTNPMQFIRELCIDPLPTASARARDLGASVALPPAFDAWFSGCVVRDVHARFPNARAAIAALASVWGPEHVGGPGALMFAESDARPSIDVGGVRPPTSMNVAPSFAPTSYAPSSTPSGEAWKATRAAASVVMVAGPASLPPSVPFSNRDIVLSPPSFVDTSRSPHLVKPKPTSKLPLILGGVGLLSVGGAALVWALFLRSPRGRGSSETKASATSSSAPKRVVSVDQTTLALYFNRNDPQNPATARNRFAAECERGDASACAGVSLFQLIEGTPADRDGAVKTVRTSCEGGNALGCVGLAVAYHRGWILGKNEVRATELFQQACTLGVTLACTYWGDRLANGVGHAKDLAQANKILSKACGLGGQDACAYLGAVLTGPWEGHDPELGFDRASKACDEGSMMGCVVEANAYTHGLGVKADPSKAVGLLRRACDNDEWDGCHTVAHVYLAKASPSSPVQRDVARGIEYFERGCTHFDYRSCEDLGTLYAKGVDVPADAAKAIGFYEEACNDGFAARSCRALSDIYRTGAGVLADANLAAEFEAKACALNKTMCHAVAAPSAGPSAGAPPDL